jgi:5-methylcytosine-specific restriction endonuclease McrA
MEQARPLAEISDDELLRRLAELLQQSRRVESDLIAHIAEVDERRLYAREASPSMFAYCTDVLHLSEAEAYLRITVARASREHPMLLTMLGDGRLHLTGIAKLAPHLTLENRDALLRRATHRSKRQIEELIAEMTPRGDAPALVRKLPARKPLPVPALALGPDGVGLPGPELGPDGVGAGVVEVGPDRVAASAAPARSSPEVPRPLPPAIVQPLAPARYKVQFTASAQLRDTLERLRALMRSEVPDGDLGAIIERAVTEKLERLEGRRFARTSRPRKGLAETDTSPSSRHIPSAVRRAVRERDGNRCSYLDESGRRCSERGRLEYHHRHPFGLGEDHSPKNIRLMCRAHNAYLAEHDYGREAMARHRRPRNRVSGPSALRGSPG